MLQPHHFSFQCPLKLTELDQVDGAYHCHKCHKNIHDLTDCSLDEVRELQRRHGSICGFVRLVGISSMLSLAACTKDDQGRQPAGTKEETPKAPEQERVLMGDICLPETKQPATPQPPPAPHPAEAPNAQNKPNQPHPAQDLPEAPQPPGEIPVQPVEPPREIIMGLMRPMLPEKPEDPNPPV